MSSLVRTARPHFGTSAPGDLLRSVALLEFESRPEGLVTFSSERLAEVLGHQEPDSLIGQPLRELFPDAETLQELLQQIEEGSRVEGLETRLARIDGAQIEVMVQAVLISGTPCSIGRAVITDLSRFARRRDELEAQNRLLRLVIDHLPVSVSVRDWDGRYVLANKMQAAARGLPSMALEGRRESELDIDPVMALKSLEEDRRVMGEGVAISISQREISTPDSHKRVFEILKVPLPMRAGEEKRVLEVSTDITKWVAETEAPQRERTYFRQLVEYASDSIYQLDAGGRATYLNPAARRILGLGEGELVGRKLIEVVREDYRPEVERFYRQQFEDKIANTYLELPVVASDGREIWLAQNVQLIFEEGRLSGFQAVARDVTDRKRLEDQLAHLATHDSLTDLFNRSFFEAQLDLKAAQCLRYGTSGAVVMIDLDGFKEINDTLGHSAGDAFLADFAEFLASRFRETDVVARLGGDEFAVLIDYADREAIHSLGVDLLERIRQHSATIEKSSVSSNASIGIALFPEHGTTREELLGHADQALYEAKRRGRNCFLLYEQPSTKEDGSWENPSTWVGSVRAALAERDFLLYAQPIESLRGHGLLYYEGLLRLRHPDGRIVDAGAFLDLADRMGLLPELDRWVLQQALSFLERTRTRDEVSIGINLTSKSMADPNFVQCVRDGLERISVAPSRLIFEITESAAISSFGLAREFMGTLSSLGCRFALDDFGVGFSSLHRLKQLPVDYLKIDGAFVRNIAQDRADWALVKAIVEVASALGKQAIAEFVEDEETVSALQRAGVDYGQGFHLGRSKPIDEIPG